MDVKRFEKFEDRITHTFIRYGTIPLFILLGLLVVMGFVGYLYTNVYQVWRLQDISHEYFNGVASSIDYLESQTIDILNQGDIQSINKELYQLYYVFNQDYSYTGHYIILNDNRESIFTTRLDLLASDYSKLYIQYVLNHVDTQNGMISTINLDGEGQQRYLIFANKIEDSHGKQYYTLVYFDAMNIQMMMDLQRSNHFVITDRFNNVIGTTSSEMQSSAFKFNPSNSTSLVVYDTDYRVYVKDAFESLIFVHVLVQNNFMFLFLLALIVTALVTFSLLKRINKKMAQKIGHEVSESVNTIVSHVKEIQAGNLSASVDLNTHDEFQFLSEAINEMSRELDYLIVSNQRLIELRKNAEIRQLEAQFNPHFLFNSLEAMRYLITENPDRAQNMVVNLSRLLRYSIANDQNEIQFREDAKYIEMYLEIHKERLGERLNYTIDLEPNVESVMIPKLIIQPLVENSIKHGYKHCERLNIGVVGYEHNETVFIHVIDDGGGMPQNLVEALNARGWENTGLESGFGVSSVIQRIDLMYGDTGMLYIESDSYGTYITICFPKGGNYEL